MLPTESLAQLASSVAELTTRAPTDAGPEVEALSARAKDLSTAARTAGFAELADQAHALFQRLEAIAKKLHRPN